MCAQSQSANIACRHIWQGFNPLGFDRGIFVLLRGYMDESYGSDQNIFSFSCLLARGKDWDDMERRWKLQIEAKNKQLAKEGRPTISRYHASDCSGCRNEFAGWTRNERDAFVLKLFGTFKLFPSHTVAIEMQLEDLCEVFPEWASDRLRAAYHVFTQFIMYHIVEDIRRFARHGAPVKVTLFHDRTGGEGEYDPTILRAFNQAINRPGFNGGHYFTTIAPLAWNDSLALQPADLVAFECFKMAEAKLAARKTRKSFDALLDMATFGIHSMGFRKDLMIDWRQRLEEGKKIAALEG
jgi:hypothetical protein